MEPRRSGDRGGTLRAGARCRARSEYHTDGDTLATVYPDDLEALATATAALAGDIAILPISRVAEPFWPPLGAATRLPDGMDEMLHAHLEHEH